MLDALETSPPEPDAIVFPDTGWVRFVLTPEAGAELMARHREFTDVIDAYSEEIAAGSE